MNIRAILDGNEVTIVDLNRVGSSAYVTFINPDGSLVSDVYHTSAFSSNDISISLSAYNVPDNYSVSAVGPLISTPGLSPVISVGGLTGNSSKWTVTADIQILGGTSATSIYTSGAINVSSAIIRNPSEGLSLTSDGSYKIAIGSGSLYLKSNENVGIVIDSSGDVTIPTELSVIRSYLGGGSFKTEQDKIGFFGSTPVVKQTVSGTTIPNPVLETNSFMAMLQNVYSALKAYNLI